MALETTSSSSSSWCSSDLTWILIILAGYYIFYEFIWKTWWYFDQRDVKYVRGLPLLGSRYRSILAIDNERDTLHTLYSTYSDEPFIGVYDLLGRPSYIIRDLYLVKQLTDITSMWPREKPIDRSDVSPFCSDNSDEMCTMISDCAREFCESLLLTHYNGVRSNDYEAKDLFGRYASNVVAWSTLGNRINTLESVNSEFYRTCCSIVNWRCAQKSRLCDYLHLDTMKDFVNMKIVGDKNENFFRSVAERKIQKRLQSKARHFDMVNHVIKNAKGNDMVIEICKESILIA